MPVAPKMGRVCTDHKSRRGNVAVIPVTPPEVLGRDSWGPPREARDSWDWGRGRGVEVAWTWKRSDWAL